MKSKYNVVIILFAVTAIFLFRSYSQKHDPKESHFSERKPATFKKAHQLINIDIDYEKLPARNEIRLIGRINASHLETDVLDYRWILAKNIKLKRGTETGKINLKVSNEVTLDVAIIDMNKKIDVKLEASVRAQKIKIGGIKTFTFDPLHQDDREAASLEEQKKIQQKDSQLPKEEFLKKELNSTQKTLFQQ